jgi:hypothetical protein
VQCATVQPHAVNSRNKRTDNLQYGWTSFLIRKNNNKKVNTHSWQEQGILLISSCNNWLKGQ